MSKVRIAGGDPGFANIGFCVVDLYSIGGSDLLGLCSVQTAKGKGKVNQIDDELRRLHEIEDALIGFLDEYKPDVFAMEEPGKCLMKRPPLCRCKGNTPVWQTNPTTLRTSSLMWGAASGICRTRGIYVVKYTSQEIKKALCNKNSASKEDIQAAVQKLYPTFTGWPKAKSKIEHVADAVGAAVTAFREPFIMSLLRTLEAGNG